MKKTALALILSFVLALGLSACGLQPSGGDTSSSGGREYDWQKEEGRDTSQNKVQQNNSSQEQSPEESSSDEHDSANSSSALPADESPLMAWYNSGDRTILENLINNMYNDSGLTFFVTIQEPDIIIYNYQYIEQLDFAGMSQADIDTYFTNGLDDGAADIVSDIRNFQTSYGIPLTTIRMNYLNADGSLIFTTDFTEDYVSPSAGDGSSSAAFSGTYDSLQDWLDSEEARSIVEATNSALASSGMVMDLSADGNIFVYEYYISDSLGIDSLSQDQISAVLDPVIEGQRSSLLTLFAGFESDYGIRLDGIRVVFYTESGTELYSTDIVNE
ncbi:MAG: DUF4854 domain-containing protein [Lachnospiraceae bacterium]|nr:DUF4854 domain-containing protein [Lachnospiraceae bacterium]